MKVLFVILTILKIIGIILASIVGLILLLAALILFVPIRYNGKVNFIKKPDVDLRISYLLHILSLRFIFKENEKDFSIKLFGHKLGEKKEKKKKARKKKSKSKTEVKTAVKDNTVRKNTEKSPDYEISDDEPKHESRFEDDYDSDSEPNKKKSIFKKIKDKYNSFVPKFKNALKEIDDPANRHAIKLLAESLGKVLKAVRPKKHTIYMKFGTDDPANTGEILGIIYSFAYLAGLNLEILPDFDNKIFEVESDFKGQVRLITLGIIAIKLYRNDNFKKLIHKFL